MERVESTAWAPLACMELRHENFAAATPLPRCRMMKAESKIGTFFRNAASGVHMCLHLKHRTVVNPSIPSLGKRFIRKHSGHFMRQISLCPGYQEQKRTHKHIMKRGKQPATRHPGPLSPSWTKQFITKPTRHISTNLDNRAHEARLRGCTDWEKNHDTHLAQRMACYNAHSLTGMTTPVRYFFVRRRRE